MNYIHQIKGFWITQEINQLGTSEIAMYFYMLEIWNKTGWIGCFKRNNYKVMADLSIRSPKTLQSIRDKLQTAGIMTFKQRNGVANVEYVMNDLSNFYLGSGIGKGIGSVEGKGIGSGIVNINQTETKPNETNTPVANAPEPALTSPKEKEVSPPPCSAPPPSRFPFEEFWDRYDKKRAKPKCEAKWKQLKETEREQAMRALPEYVRSTPNPQYRKDPIRWLGGKCWNDEIIHQQIYQNGPQRSTNTSGIGRVTNFDKP